MSILANIAAVRTQLNTDIIANGTEDITGTLLNTNLINLLDTLQAKLVTTYIGRAGAVVAVASDYDASLVDNDSGVSGAFVDDALDALAALIVTNASDMALADGTRDITGSQIFEANVVVEGQAYSETNTLTDESTIATNCNLGNVHKVVLTANRTLGAPTNLKDGSTYIWRIIQDAGGTNTLAYNSVFKFPDGTAPTLSTGGDAIDILTGVSDGTNIYCSMQNEFS